jgi:hypothetical protein
MHTESQRGKNARLTKPSRASLQNMSKSVSQCQTTVWQWLVKHCSTFPGLWSISLSSMTTFFVVYIRATFFSSSYTLLQTMLYVICKAFVLMLLEQQLQMLEHCTPHMHVMILGLPTQLACVSSITTDAVII